jgi:hypothetical protein
MPATPPTTTNAPAPETIMRDSRAENTTDDDRIYEEAIKHILTPKRQRTTVTSESLAAIRRAVNKP